MIKLLTREVALAMQARSGINAAGLTVIGLTAIASATAFVFALVAGYDWLALRYDATSAALIMAVAFMVVAVVSASISVLLRQRVRERAILARAARAHAPSWLFDPRLITTAVQAGRSVGWQRIVPIALVVFMAAQWAREERDRGRDGAA